MGSPPAEDVRTTAGRGGLLARGRRSTAPSRPTRPVVQMPSASPLTVAGAAPECSPASLVSAGNDSSAAVGVRLPKHMILQNNPMQQKITNIYQLVEYVHFRHIRDRGERGSAASEAGFEQPAQPIVEAVDDLREGLNDVFRAVVREDDPPRPSVAVLNAAIERAFANRRLRPIGRGAIDWTWSSANAGLEMVVWEITLAAAGLLTDAERRRRIRICANGPCDWMFLDASRGGRRRWCRMGVCGTPRRSAASGNVSAARGDRGLPASAGAEPSGESARAGYLLADWRRIRSSISALWLAESTVACVIWPAATCNGPNTTSRKPGTRAMTPISLSCHLRKSGRPGLAAEPLPRIQLSQG